MKKVVCQVCESHTSLFSIGRTLVCFRCAKDARDWLIQNNLADYNPFFMKLVVLGEPGSSASLVRFKGQEFLEVWTRSSYDRSAHTPVRIRINDECKEILLSQSV